MNSRHWWLWLVLGAELALAEWVRFPRPIFAVVAVLLWLAAAVAVGLPRGRGRSPLGVALASVLVAKAALLAWAQLELRSIQHDWSRVREARITSAAARWERELKYSRAAVERLASAAAAAGDLPREAAFDRLAHLLRPEPLEVGLVIVEADGTPSSWAGRHRLTPEAEGDSIRFRASPYYAVIESRRHLSNGRTAVASLLLAADSTVPDQAKSLARRFERQSGVDLAILPEGLAPDTSDVFDYVEPTAQGPRLLFSVRLTPPSQTRAFDRANRAAVVRLGVLSVLSLVLSIAVAPPGWGRFALVALPALIVVRAPVADALGFGSLFSSRTFFHTSLGPVSRSAGALGLTCAALAVLVMGGLAYRRPRRWWGAPVAALLLLGAPFAVSALGRGVQIPAEGVTTGLWLAWELTVFLVACVLILVAAALLPERRSPKPAARWPAVLGSGVAVVATLVGLLVWNARFGWPDWYPLFWTLALGFVVWPGRRALTLTGVGVAVGSAAALMVWGAEIEGRIRAARADLAGLGARADPIAIPLLQSFASRVEVGAPPKDASELFALWRSSPLSGRRFPTSLGLHGADGSIRARLRLDEVDLPDSLVRDVVRQLPPEVTEHVVALHRIPSVHYLGLIRLNPTTVLTVGLGPRTTLVPQARLGRLLEPAPTTRPLYRLSLAPTGSLEQPQEEAGRWRREEWTARGSRTVAMAGGARDVFGVVELGAPGTLIVRGALLVFLDLLVLFALAGLSEWVWTGRLVRPHWLPEWRAFRTRIALALGGFFLLPAASFATINILELARDGQSRRDLMIAQTLRDAAPGSKLPLVGGTQLDQALESLSERVDANLVLYRDGRLLASSGAGVFESFGAVNPLIDPSVFHRIQIDGETEAVTDGPSAIRRTRLGVRSVQLPTADAAMLASPQATGDPTIAAQQLDLAYGLALAVVLGLAAALVGAQYSARALSRPAAELRDAALAFGRGEPLPPPQGVPPPEFAPVFAALEKMAADVRATQEAQERAARVLAWGEMANQIAHEIKNPLTPMRLGIQHLQRVHRDGRPLGPTLEETARRILGEIDRLDMIARAFSRFAAPAADRADPEPTPLGDVCREVVALYGLAPGGNAVILDARGEVPVLALRDEVKEALINLLENARNAEAQRIVVRIRGSELTVEDDGAGIPADWLPRIFEPRFSTTTSGSGLGLAIVKRLVERWGATIEVASEVGRGTVVTIRFREAPSDLGLPQPAA